MPNSVLTIYNCGTAFHRHSGDTVSRLYNETLSDEVFVNDGVGSGSWWPTWLGGRGNPGEASKLGGMLFGEGLEANVEAAIQVIHDFEPKAINMCGWSRGGVTCTKISAQLFHKWPKLAGIPVNIFAIDPVPGDSAGNAHMWRDIELTPNVANYYVVFAQHESLRPFAPTYPSIGGPTNVTVEIMPGSHGAVAGTPDTNQTPDAGMLVTDLAKRFLLRHRTNFSQRSVLSASEIITLYARVQKNFARYRQMAEPGFLERLFGRSAGRTIMDDKRGEKGFMKTDRAGFFVNEHQRDAFQAKYFYLTQQFDNDAQKAFQGTNTSSGWGRDVLTMEEEEPLAYGQLAVYLNETRGLVPPSRRYAVMETADATASAG